MNGPIGKTFRPGERAPVSGRYAMLDASGRSTGTVRFVDRDAPFPPGSEVGAAYVLEQAVEARFTSTASAAILADTVAAYPTAMRELAKR